MHRYFTYILKCNDGSLYVGITNNIDRRLKEHQSGYHEGSYTARHLPVELVFVREFKWVREAIAYEKKLKRWTHEKKMALIEGDYDRLKKLSKKDFSKRKLNRS